MDSKSKVNNHKVEDVSNVDNLKNIDDIKVVSGHVENVDNDINQTDYIPPVYDYNFFNKNPASFDCIRKATIKKFKKYKVNTSKAGLFMQVMLKRTARKCNSWVMYYDIAVDPTLIPVDQPTTKKSSRQRTRSLDSVEVDVLAARKFHKRSFLKRSSSVVLRS
ncbi:hypothetical protein HELRODRAFT_171287 [Helobdella robusta]|uniref:Uncharacterized protein n=1 Tax=Helobdella robusta TaxID=6412 RepID=T1F414_HELRO|nr:hypothetical protein HELRODRAFT_171285 [Helobdella robusta]XP_009016265.1 hypothetical protein HELRODRAFT_171287 [Helobdella robusta]ESO05630.1 hypothetical protein HELRODRAFT_171285 [Helobdella robusta]ESO05632.1 hypothetical protein HELRODRAFT_171287 [Helobdella robusta]